MTGQSTNEGNRDSEQSTSGTSQPLSADALKNLQSQMEAEIERRVKEAESRWQSDKDRRIPKLEAEQSNLRKTIEDALKLGKSGATAEEIEKQIKIERLLARMDGEGNLVTQKPDKPQSTQTTEAQRIAKEAGLDMNDKDVAEAVASNDLLRLVKVATAKAGSPSPSISDAPPPEGIVPQNGTDTELLIKQLSTLQKNPTKYKVQIAGLTAELDKRGWK